MTHKFLPWMILIAIQCGFFGGEIEAVKIDSCPTLVKEFHAIVSHEQSSANLLSQELVTESASEGFAEFCVKRTARSTERDPANDGSCNDVYPHLKPPAISIWQQFGSRPKTRDPSS
jgi:hypothetical protein